MKYTVLGFREYCRNVLLNVFLACQLAIVFVLINIVIGYYNNLAMLYTPFDDILSKPGFYMCFDDMKAFRDNNELSEPKDQEEKLTDKAFKEMKGDKRIIRSYQYYINDDVTVIVLDDSIFKKLRLPLETGKIIENKAIVTKNSGYKIGSSIELGNGKAEVGGILTEITYIPYMNSYVINMTDKDLYERYEAGISNKEYVIISESMARDNIDSSQLNSEGYYFVIFDNISDSDYNHNKKIAENYFTFVETSIMNDNALYSINSKYKKFIPILIIIVICAVIGVVSYSTISILKATKSNKIYYICGATLAQCFVIVLIKGVIIFFNAVMIGIIIFSLMIHNGLFQGIGISIQSNNILYSIIMILSMFVFYSIVSLIVFSDFRRREK